MEQQNTTNTEKKEKSASKPKEKFNLVEAFKDFRGEFRKIIWPNRQDLVKQTTTVIITSLVVGLIVFLMDSVFTIGYNFIINLLG